MRRLQSALLAIALAAAPVAVGQDPWRLTIDRIVRSADFGSAPLPVVHRLADGRSYIDLRAAPAGGTDMR